MARDLKGKTIRSVMWSILRVAWTSLATFVVFIFLTRLLDPHAFGLFALSTVFVDVAKVLASAGLAEAITRELDLEEETADTAFWANLVFSIVVMIIVGLAAGPYASFMRDPILSDVIWALAIILPIQALGAVHTARLLRDFGHKALTIRTIIATFVGSCVGIAAALSGFGVWSLVAQSISSELLSLVFAWISFRWRPKFRFSGSRLRKLLGFSVSMMITQVFWVMLARVPELFIGRTLGPADVGRYRVAWRLIDLVGQAVLSPISNVMLITLSHVQNDRERFARIYDRIVATAGLFSFPVLFGVGALADDLIPLIFGAQWQGNGALLQIFVLMALPFTMNYFAAPALAAKGNSGSILIVAAVQFVLTVALSFFAAPYGLAAIALAYVARAYITMFYQNWVLQQRTGISALRSLQNISGPLLSAGIMAVCVYLVRFPIGEYLDIVWLKIAFLVAFGGAIYAVLILIGSRHLVLEALGSIVPSENKFMAPVRSWLAKRSQI